jgi:hypothetical protein
MDVTSAEMRERERKRERERARERERERERESARKGQYRRFHPDSWKRKAIIEERKITIYLGNGSYAVLPAVSHGIYIPSFLPSFATSSPSNSFYLLQQQPERGSKEQPMRDGCWIPLALLLLLPGR